MVDYTTFGRNALLHVFAHGALEFDPRESYRHFGVECGGVWIPPPSGSPNVEDGYSRGSVYGVGFGTTQGGAECRATITALITVLDLGHRGPVSCSIDSRLVV